MLRSLKRSERPADEKSHLFFLQNIILLFCRVRHTALGVPYKGATGRKENMKNVNSGSRKKQAVDTRNNWVTMMFVTHNRYNCIRKQIYIYTCIEAFRLLEHFGFEFGNFDFTMNHVHFFVNILKRYFFKNVEIILSQIARK